MDMVFVLSDGTVVSSSGMPCVLPPNTKLTLDGKQYWVGKTEVEVEWSGKAPKARCFVCPVK